MNTPAVLPEAQPLSHEGSTRTGVLVIHGFTGNPSSMRGIAEAMVALGHHVEMPRLPGHGTTVEEMVTTGWADWTGEVRSAHGRLAARVDEIVVVGLSMGGSLTLWSGFELPNVVGLVCINPATTPQAAPVLDMIQEMVDDGTEIAPAIGGDIADPDVQESSYDGAPLRPLLSFMREGLTPDDRSVRRTDDAVAADHVPPGSRGRAGELRAPRRTTTAARSSTSGSNGAITSPPRTTTAPTSNA